MMWLNITAYDMMCANLVKLRELDPNSNTADLVVKDLVSFADISGQNPFSVNKKNSIAKNLKHVISKCEERVKIVEKKLKSILREFGDVIEEGIVSINPGELNEMQILG